MKLKMNNIKGPSNLFDIYSLAKENEQIEELIVSNGFRLEKIVSFGHPSPDGFWYEQERDEWVLLIKGSASLEFSGGMEEILSEGDYFIIPHHVKHRVKRVSYDAIWLTLHYDGKINNL